MADWELRFRQERDLVDTCRSDIAQMEIDAEEQEIILEKARDKVTELWSSLKQAQSENEQLKQQVESLENTMLEAAKQLNDLEDDAKNGWKRAQELEQLVSEKEKQLAAAQLEVMTNQCQLEAAILSRNEWRAAAGGLESYANLQQTRVEQLVATVATKAREAKEAVTEVVQGTRDELTELESRWRRCEDQRFAAVEQCSALESLLRSESSKKAVAELQRDKLAGDLAASERRRQSWQELCIEARWFCGDDADYMQRLRQTIVEQQDRIDDLQAEYNNRNNDICTIMQIAEEMRQLACHDKLPLVEQLRATQRYLEQLYRTVHEQQAERERLVQNQRDTERKWLVQKEKASELLETVNSLGLAVETRERELTWTSNRLQRVSDAFYRGMRIQQTKIDHLEADLCRAEEVAVDHENHWQATLNAGRDAVDALSSRDEPTLALQLKQVEEHLLGRFGTRRVVAADEWASSRAFELERQVLDMTMGDAGFERVASQDLAARLGGVWPVRVDTDDISSERLREAAEKLGRTQRTNHQTVCDDCGCTGALREVHGDMLCWDCRAASGPEECGYCERETTNCPGGQLKRRDDGVWWCRDCEAVHKPMAQKVAELRNCIDNELDDGNEPTVCVDCGDSLKGGHRTGTAITAQGEALCGACCDVRLRAALRSTDDAEPTIYDRPEPSTPRPMPEADRGDLIGRLLPVISQAMVGFALTELARTKLGQPEMPLTDFALKRDGQPNSSEQPPTETTASQPPTCTREQSEALRATRGNRRGHRARKSRESCRESSFLGGGTEGRTCQTKSERQVNNPVTESLSEDACQKMASRLHSQSPERATSWWVDIVLDTTSRLLGLSRTQDLALRMLVKR